MTGRGSDKSGGNARGAEPGDPLIRDAGRSLAAGDPLAALNRVALRDDAPALALRGIAMAQLGDLDRAGRLLRRAAVAFGAAAPVARARCVVAEAEVALAARELGWPQRRLDQARATLERHGDAGTAAHARLLHIRRLLLVGQLDAADAELAALDPGALSPAARTVCELVAAGSAMRRIRPDDARAALGRARAAAGRAAIPALAAEVERAAAALDLPAARRIERGRVEHGQVERGQADRGAGRAVTLDAVAALFASDALVIDACRHAVRRGAATVELARRPVLFALAWALAAAWPGDAAREDLLRHAFGARHADESHRARLRVEIARLRVAMRGLAGIRATGRGFAMLPEAGAEVVLLARPFDDAHGAVLALLADGQAWSSSALALALGTSQRGVQRALEALSAAGRAEAIGRGRARRWRTPPMPGFATSLLLPPPLPGA